MKIRLLFIAIILIYANQSFGQFEISASASKEAILDELKWVYDNGNHFNLALTKTDKYKHKRTVYGAYLSYGYFKPKQDIFYYLLPENQYGSIEYANYNQYQIGATARRDFIFRKKFELFVGWELGYQSVRSSFFAQDPNSSEDSYFTLMRAVVSPKAGFSFVINQHASIFIQSKYSLSIGENLNQADKMNYFWSNGIGLNLRFE